MTQNLKLQLDLAVGTTCELMSRNLDQKAAEPAGLQHNIPGCRLRLLRLEIRVAECVFLPDRTDKDRKAKSRLMELDGIGLDRCSFIFAACETCRGGCPRFERNLDVIKSPDGTIIAGATGIFLSLLWCDPELRPHFMRFNPPSYPDLLLQFEHR